MRIYQDFFDEKTMTLNERNKHHVLNVMRCRIDDELRVFDGIGRERKVVITSISKKEITVKVLETVDNQSESPLNIHLFQALCKGEKMDWIIQKSVELGVTDITPMMTERCDIKLSSDRLEKKYEHWKNIIISATEQSGRSILPLLHESITLKDALCHADNMRLLLTPSLQNKLSNVVITQSNIAIFIGPEGGFSEAEIMMAKNQAVQCVTLGKRILRTETASLVAIAALQTRYGDF